MDLIALEACKFEMISDHILLHSMIPIAYLGFAVFDILPLVQDNVIPSERTEEVYILSDDVVGCDDQVVRMDGVPQPIRNEKFISTNRRVIALTLKREALVQPCQYKNSPA